MLDGFERDDDVDGSVGQRQLGTGAFDKTHACTVAIPRARMRDRWPVDVDTHHIRRHLAQQGGPVAFAACRVEHALAASEAARERVAMPMLVCDFASAAGKEALAGERN